MKKCDCKIMNTLGKYQKIWPWIGAAGYAIDGAEVVLKHTKWGKAHYKLRMLLHGAGAGLLCLGAGVHTAQAFADRHGADVAVRRQRLGHRLGHPRPELHARRGEEDRRRSARVCMHRVFCAMTGLGIAAARDRRQAAREH